jgi:hypothetical protein
VGSSVVGELRRMVFGRVGGALIVVWRCLRMELGERWKALRVVLLRNSCEIGRMDLLGDESVLVTCVLAAPPLAIDECS